MIDYWIPHEYHKGYQQDFTYTHSLEALSGAAFVPLFPTPVTKTVPQLCYETYGGLHGDICVVVVVVLFKHESNPVILQFVSLT